MNKPAAQDLFSRALEIPDAVARRAYLDRACAGEQTLRTEVESLLRAHEEAGDFLAQTVPLSAPDFTVERAGVMIGRYKLLEKIGEGGFGAVFMAEQVQPVQRRVALKIIKAGMDTKEVVARFEAERQALALMDHPNIARVLDAGATEAGRPYFVMELVRGIPLTEFCDQKQLSTIERLQLFIKVCHAVQHAHQKGIIHRDLKPNNVLVTLHDGEPVPKIIDFGVAKALGQKLTEKTLFTGFHHMIGTPAYMSPEQAELSGLDVDTRSDIYSLGVLLYELLTGATPFDADTLRQAALDEVRRMIRETEPPKPSTRLQTLGEKLTDVAKRRHTEPQALRRMVSGDLDWIVMKALEKDRKRRYETPNALARDVEHYLHAEPVVAVPPSFGYQLLKFARRNRMSLAGTALALIGILLVSACIGWVIRDRQARKTAFGQQIDVALDDAGKAYARGDLEEAETEVRNAEILLGTATVNKAVAFRVHRWRTDLEMVRRLEAIHENSLVAMMQSRTKIPGLGNTLGDERAIAQESDRAYREAFNQYDLPILDLSDQAAAERVNRSPIKVHLVAALDHWAMIKWIEGSEGSQDLLALAETVDHDPWRERIREALLSGGDEELPKLAEDPEIADSPPLFVKLFAVVLDKAQKRSQAIDFLRLAQQSHPDDYWINEFLSFLLCESGRYQEASGFGRASLALKPDAWWSHGGLARDLSHDRTLRGQKEAEFHFRQAIQLNPAQPYHYAFVAETLLRQLGQDGKSTDAAEMDKAIRTSLELAAGFYNQAIEHGARDQWTLFQAASLSLHCGDLAAYRRCCALMMHQFGQTEDASIAGRVAKTCLLLPDDKDDLQPFLRLAEFSVKGAEQQSLYPWKLLTCALADYRCGRYEPARKWLEKCRPKNNECSAMLASIKAMTLQKLGRYEEAHVSFVQAQALISQHAFRKSMSEPYEVCDWVRASILCQEAEALLGHKERRPIPIQNSMNSPPTKE